MSKIIQNIGMISQTKHLKFPDLQHMVEAFEIQSMQHRYPKWGRETHIHAFKRVHDLPHGFWPHYVRDDIGEPGASGYHTDKNNQPVIFTQWNGFDETSITGSHENIETSQDPYGNRLIHVVLPGVGPVGLLAELSDPPEAQSYKIGDVSVSDFLLPAWYGYDAQDPEGSALTYLDSIKHPLTLIEGGYMSYVMPNGEWRQDTWFDGPAPITNVLGSEDSREPDESLREWIDRITRPKQK